METFIVVSEDSNSSNLLSTTVLPSGAIPCAVNFPFCGRCAGRGFKVPPTSFGSCPKCPKARQGNLKDAELGGAFSVVKKSGKSNGMQHVVELFCLRCENFLNDAGSAKHATSSCPHKSWFMAISVCVVCGSKHGQTSETNAQVIQMFEFVFSALRYHSELRRSARTKFTYRDPGVMIKSWDTPGTVADFLEWLVMMDDGQPCTNFARLFTFVKDWVKLDVNV